MGVIHYHLHSGATLDCMVPVPGGNATLPPNMVPGASGIYVIQNRNYAPPNIYVGKSANLVNRWQHRLETIGEIHVNAAYMRNVVAWWGDVYHINAPTNTGPVFRANRAAGIAMGTQVLMVAQNPSCVIDGNFYFIEQVLIRAYLSTYFIGPCTSTNNVLVGQIFLPGGSPGLEISIDWAAIPAAGIVGGVHDIALIPGGGGF